MPVASEFLYTKGHPETCQWAAKPAAMQWPGWIDPKAAVWTCHRGPQSRAVTFSDCEHCERWEPRPSFPESPQR
jgi:hypothetical protein